MSIITVFWMVIKQIIKNWKLEMVLLIGLILAVAVASSISIYTDGVLEFVMGNRWEQLSSVRYPQGAISVIDEHWRDYHPILSPTGGERDPEDAFQQYQDLESFLQQRVDNAFGTEQLFFSKTGRSSRESIFPADPDEMIGNQYADVKFIKGLENKVEMIDGRWIDPDQQHDDRVYEVVIDEFARDDMGLMAGKTYLFPLKGTGREDRQFLRFKVVGVFRVPGELFNEPIWVDRPPYRNSFFVTEADFEDIILMEGTEPYAYEWFWVYDHEPIKSYQVPGAINILRRMETDSGRITDNMRLRNTPLYNLRGLGEQAEILTTLLLILSLPVLGIIFYYIILAASLTINRRSAEIAMLKSRGAGILQVLFTYLLEWGLLGGVAFLIGPQVGSFIALAIGASSGFLEFVERTRLPVYISPNSYRMALYVVGLAVLMCLVMVIPAARHSIVSYKLKSSRNSAKPFWQRYYLDIVMLIFSIYGYRVLMNHMETIRAGESSALVIDPMLFLIPVLFLATAGLLSLRIIPWILRLISIITSRLPEVSLTVTLRQFFRNPAQSSPLLFFIIMAVALGIYSSAIARTFNQNFTDSVMYRRGAELVLNERWDFTPVTGGEIMGPDGQPMGNAEEQESVIQEPPFHIHEDLPGVKSAARVFSRSSRISSSGNREDGTLMGIYPAEFANVTWFREDLAPFHLHSYMNLLLSNRSAALVNRKYVEDNNLDLGDRITARRGEFEIDFYIAGIIDLWPTVYPDDLPLVIGNLDYIQFQSMLEPYNVWLNIEENADLQLIVDQLAEENVYVDRVIYAPNEIISNLRNPQVMGLFGMLSIGFIMAVVITVLGFFLYNFLSLKKRVVQFGVMRSIGLSIPQLISILSLEQLFTVGIAFVLGTIYGIIMSRVFLPFLQISQNITDNIPDFLIIIKQSDIFNILYILGGTLLIGLIILGIMMAKLKLHEAVKLGEEA